MSSNTQILLLYFLEKITNCPRRFAYDCGHADTLLYNDR